MNNYYEIIKYLNKNKSIKYKKKLNFQFLTNFNTLQLPTFLKYNLNLKGIDINHVESDYDQNMQKILSLKFDNVDFLVICNEFNFGEIVEKKKINILLKNYIDQLKSLCNVKKKIS